MILGWGSLRDWVVRVRGGVKVAEGREMVRVAGGRPRVGEGRWTVGVRGRDGVRGLVGMEMWTVGVGMGMWRVGVGMERWRVAVGRSTARVGKGR